jgi:orotate phosphoribosyltransferase
MDISMNTSMDTSFNIILQSYFTEQYTNNLNSIIQQLIQTNSIKLGNFTLKSGQISKYYYDMKNIISYPSLLSSIGELLYNNIINSGIKFDMICALPLGGLPICSYISFKYNIPMIVLRDNTKQYGTKSQIDGTIIGEKCLIIDDVITSGLSINNAIIALKDKLNVVGTAVIFDRQQNPDLSIPIISAINKTEVTRYNLNRIINTKKSKICFAADCFDNINSFSSLIVSIAPYISICKIHWDIIKNKLCNDTQQIKIVKNFLINTSLEYDFLLMEDRKFIDITSVVKQQYTEFSNWIDLITTHSLVSSQTIQSLSGVVIVANMSNTFYSSSSIDFSKRAEQLSQETPRNIIAFVSQIPIKSHFLLMTPGISLPDINKQPIDKYDQNYIDPISNPNLIFTDIYIIGRYIYNNWDTLGDNHTIIKHLLSLSI